MKQYVHWNDFPEPYTVVPLSMDSYYGGPYLRQANNGQWFIVTPDHSSEQALPITEELRAMLVRELVEKEPIEVVNDHDLKKPWLQGAIPFFPKLKV